MAGLFFSFSLVTPLRLERRTDCLEGNCSIQLSYGAICMRAAHIVGTPRFELGISCSQSRRDNRTTLYPVRLFPLKARKDAVWVASFRLAEKGGFEPPVP